MKLKSLILGSAAALLAVSGAHAADAIVAAEPEPVDYVRVCDAYGAGFFYIPGTETCLSISGYVWYQIAATSARDVTDTPGYYAGVADGWVKGTRVRLNFDARSDTEWGTLRGYIRLQGDWNGGFDGSVAVDQGFLELGGLIMGYTESFFVDSKNGGGSNYGSFSWGGMYYGYQERQLIGYRFGGSQGFFGAVSLEDASVGGGPYEWMPDVVAKIGVTQGWGTAWVLGAYDYDRNGAVLGDDGGFALQAGLNLNIPSMPGSAFKLIGYYNDSDNAYGPNSPLGMDPEWAVLASFKYAASSNLALILSAEYFADIYSARGSDVKTSTDAWAAEVSAVWTPVKNFEIRPEIVYSKVQGLDGTVSGYLRFTRYF